MKGLQSYGGGFMSHLYPLRYFAESLKYGVSIEYHVYGVTGE